MKTAIEAARLALYLAAIALCGVMMWAVLEVSK